MSVEQDVNEAAQSSAQILLSTKEAPKVFPPALVEALELAVAENAEELEVLCETKVKLDLTQSALVPAEEPVDLSKYIIKFRVFSETEDWFFIVSLSHHTLYDYLELVLGAQERGHTFEGTRVPSEIDTAIGKSFADRFSRALCGALSSLDDLNVSSFCCEPLIEDPEVPALSGEIYRADFLAVLFDHESEFMVAFPAEHFSVLANADIAANLPPPPAVANEAWTSHMSTEARRATIQLTARLSAGTATLDSLSQLSPGMVLPLEATPNSMVEMECNSVPLMRCKFGQADGRYAVAVESFIKPSTRSSERELAVALGMLTSA